MVEEERVYDIFSTNGEHVASVIAFRIGEVACKCKIHWPCKVKAPHINVELDISKDGVPTVSSSKREKR